MNPLPFPLWRLAPLLALAAPLGAQITLVDSGALANQLNLADTYTQNFDSLPSTAPLGGVDWVNNTNLRGWYSTAGQSKLLINSTFYGLSSYGDNSDRAFGSTGAYWGLRFLNSTSQTITGFSVSYDVEQWYRAANDPQVSNGLRLYYKTYPTNYTEGNEMAEFGAGGWTQVSSAAFFTPNSTLTTASMIDGNLAENKGTVSVVISGITVLPGQKLWLRWINGEDPGNDHALAIDDLSVSFSTAAIPEPASAAALLALAALASASRRRTRSLR